MSPAGGQQLPHEQFTEHVTCLGCGCACDDIAVRVSASRIVELRNACPLGARWFGDGAVPDAIRLTSFTAGEAVSRASASAGLDAALDAIASLLAGARAPLVYLAPELSCEAQRAAVGLGDVLHAAVDSITSATALPSILAAQERGRASATLGEIRNRADAIVFWGVDPDARYPRYRSRYAPEPSGLHVARGREDRRVIAVDIGSWRGPADADTRIGIDPSQEVALLTAVAALIRKPASGFDATLDALARPVVEQLSASRYAVVVADAEPETLNGATRDPQRAGALIAMVQALNGPTRAALSTLRAGGNRAGADAVLTWQTGYPAGVSFAGGFPSYHPFDGSFAADAVLIVGDAAQMPPAVMAGFATMPHAIVGPRATTHAAPVAIDTGIAGIHVGGTALRLDDLPLPLRPVVTGHRDPADVLRALTGRVAAHVAASGRAAPPVTNAGGAEARGSSGGTTSTAAPPQGAGR